MIRKWQSQMMAVLCLASILASCTVSNPTPTAVQPSPTVRQLVPPPVQDTATSPPVVVMTPTPGEVTPGLNAAPGSDFCAAPQVQAAISNLASALKDKDGADLAVLVDPVDGLDIYYRLANAPVHIASAEIVGLFTSTFIYTWGDQAGSGLPVAGTFSDELLPMLADVFERDNTQSCQDLSRGNGTGPTTALVEWPAEFAGMPFIAVFRAPGPQDNELDWRTWAVGFSLVNGQPKIRVLVQYFWEI
jgi:hypothetical protein